MPTYLERILKARVYDVAEETPLDPAPRLSARLGQRVLLKREDLQPVFSFKIRGAYNRIAQLSAAEQAAGVSGATSADRACVATEAIASPAMAQHRENPAARLMRRGIAMDCSPLAGQWSQLLFRDATRSSDASSLR